MGSFRSAAKKERKGSKRKQKKVSFWRIMSRLFSKSSDEEESRKNKSIESKENKWKKGGKKKVNGSDFATDVAQTQLTHNADYHRFKPSEWKNTSDAFDKKSAKRKKLEEESDPSANVVQAQVIQSRDTTQTQVTETGDDHYESLLPSQVDKSSSIFQAKRNSAKKGKEMDKESNSFDSYKPKQMFGKGEEENQYENILPSQMVRPSEDGRAETELTKYESIIASEINPKMTPKLPSSKIFGLEEEQKYENVNIQRQIGTNEQAKRPLKSVLAFSLAPGSWTTSGTSSDVNKSSEGDKNIHAVIGALSSKVASQTPQLADSTEFEKLFAVKQTATPMDINKQPRTPTAIPGPQVPLTPSSAGKSGNQQVMIREASRDRKVPLADDILSGQRIFDTRSKPCQRKSNQEIFDTRFKPCQQKSPVRTGDVKIAPQTSKMSTPTLNRGFSANNQILKPQGVTEGQRLWNTQRGVQQTALAANDRKNKKAADIKQRAPSLSSAISPYDALYTKEFYKDNKGNAIIRYVPKKIAAR